ncbi:PREDICTED: chymotrypsinogen B-like [Condylura cristata]|uniref:chymotrypsinogen B-like n=1 Tax=Condylura cristata TaxID=143302 RepID=UPI000642E8C5|nr:PREDICTED: chymotrypsinogen B-like [Condylura cristata]
MVFLWLFTIVTLMQDAFGSGAPASDPELSITPRIINGVDAPPDSWPWHVSLQSPTGISYCGGSLISASWVVTAAHCNITTSSFVIAGHYDRHASQDGVQILNIAQIFRHPKFRLGTIRSDVALVKLATPARIDETVSPVVLPTIDENFLPGSLCRTMGWGFTDRNGSQLPIKLQQATVHLLPKDKCKKHWKFIPRDMICVGANGAGSYVGDSGSSVVCIKYGMWTLVGIVSFVHEDKPTVIPFVATLFTKFKRWVKATMAQN